MRFLESHLDLGLPSHTTFLAHGEGRVLYSLSVPRMAATTMVQLQLLCPSELTIDAHVYCAYTKTTYASVPLDGATRHRGSVVLMLILEEDQVLQQFEQPNQTRQGPFSLCWAGDKQEVEEVGLRFCETIRLYAGRR